MASSSSRELVFLVLQFLDEEKYKEAVHRLEQDSGFFFNMKYFEDEVHNGNWDVVERYLSGFIKVDDNRFSMKIFFEIRKQKYLEALDKHDHAKAIDILVNDLKVFEAFNEELFKEITYLFTLENFRQNEQLSKYGDTQSARAIMLVELKKLIEANPLLQEKLQFPKLKSSRLRTLINQSLNWQHQLCEYPKPDPNIQTLFVDHSCGFGARTSSAATAQSRTAMPTNFPADYPSSEYDPEHERTQAVDFSEDNHPTTISSVTCAQNPRQVSHTPDDLPRTVARVLSQGSTPMSMDFHPIQHTILLVGTSVGDIGLWDIGPREKLVLKHFNVWKLKACSVAPQSVLAKDPVVSVNRILWSPDGSLFGVAYSLHIVQIYSYHGGGDIRQHLEIEAHAGGVNDIAFASPNKQLCVITCGEDKTIKVWDANTGTKQLTFEGHEASVYSVCPYSKENIPFIFSTGLDGKIKAWLYNLPESRVDYDVPGHWCTTMAYSADGSRLFSCGTSKDGVSYMVEWNECEGAIQRAYSGFNKRSLGVVQFDTTRNRFLAVGDEFLIKFWDMDSTQLLTAIDADGGLPASPRIRFNKEGSLLAISTNDNGIKILANSDGLCLLRKFENRSFEISKTVSETMAKPSVSLLSVAADATSSVTTESDTPEIATPGMNADSRNLLDVKPRSVDESIDKTNIWKFTEISESAQCRSLRLSDYLTTSRISRLVYTNSGDATLALASNAVHVLWKWPRNHRNPTGKATTNINPQVWQPVSGILMMNETTDSNPEEVVPCIALSKNDSYLMSASGGKISLFNLMTFKRITTFMPPAPAATFLAFHPRDNNIVAIGMDDSTIHIYNVPVNELKMRLRGHSRRVTGLTFSSVLNVLVSSGADAEICVWGSDEWEKIISKSMINPCVGHTQVHFHQDQIHFLAVNEVSINIYDATRLECLRQWVPPEGSSPISHATFSCDSRSIYVSFVDATVCVFRSVDLRIQCRINPAAYLHANISSNLYPVVVAAHPSDPNQFALGLTDGAIHILEPLESEGKWGATPAAENVLTRASLVPPEWFDRQGVPSAAFW